MQGLLSKSHECKFLPPLNEAPIKFPPTYKFIKNTSTYDLEKRPPAWCDRILWGLKDPIKFLDYNSVEKICFSDHKPVYGIYSIDIMELPGISKKSEIPVEPLPKSEVTKVSSKTLSSSSGNEEVTKFFGDIKK